MSAKFTDADERHRGRRHWLLRYEALGGVTGQRHLAHLVASFHPPNLAAAKVTVVVAAEALEILLWGVVTPSTWRLARLPPEGPHAWLLPQRLSSITFWRRLRWRSTRWVLMEAYLKVAEYFSAEVPL